MICKQARIDILRKVDSEDRYIVAAALTLLNDRLDINSSEVYGEYGNFLRTSIKDKNEAFETTTIERI